MDIGHDFGKVRNRVKQGVGVKRHENAQRHRTTLSIGDP
jgi:hypothetical protein